MGDYRSKSLGMNDFLQESENYPNPNIIGYMAHSVPMSAIKPPFTKF